MTDTMTSQNTDLSSWDTQYSAYVKNAWHCVFMSQYGHGVVLN
jgi:hypothetical protein